MPYAKLEEVEGRHTINNLNPSEFDRMMLEFLERQTAKANPTREGDVQKIRLWEITPDQKLAEMTNNQISLEERLEDWLESDISVLDPNLLVIGRQVTTDFGGIIDLLCLDSAGDTVVVELKQGRTPREVTAQALDYASWTKDLSSEQLAGIADAYFGSENSLASRYQERFREELPSELNLNHRSLIVAEAIDTSTERIVRYLSGMNVPVNVATVQHFTDKEGREILAQVYLIEPEEAEERSRLASKRTYYRSLPALQNMADNSGIGQLYRRMREGVRGILYPRAYQESVTYVFRIEGGGERTILIVQAIPNEGVPGLPFVAHSTRFNNFLGVDGEELRKWLPENTREEDVTHWSGSSPEERENARGLAACSLAIPRAALIIRR